MLKIYSCYPRYSCSKISCSPCERLAANKDPCDRWDPCAKNIRVIRVIRVQKKSWWHPCSKISCSKHLVRASKFIIGQFYIAASRNNSTFNIQKSKLRSAPPCANNIRVIRVITSLRSVGLQRISCSKEYTKGYALNWVLTKYILNDIEKIKERIGRIKKKNINLQTNRTSCMFCLEYQMFNV